MIVIGYPGIGKSTITKDNVGYIDYDSSLFQKEDDWAELYVKGAVNLSKMGNIVFVSSHKEVQDLLVNCSEKVVIVYPALQLHDFWIDKLRVRYEKSKSQYDYKALMRCVSNYCEDILTLREAQFENKLEITTEEYNLEDLLKNY